MLHTRIHGYSLAPATTCTTDSATTWVEGPVTIVLLRFIANAQFLFTKHRHYNHMGGRTCRNNIHHSVLHSQCCKKEYMGILQHLQQHAQQTLQPHGWKDQSHWHLFVFADAPFLSSQKADTTTTWVEGPVVTHFHNYLANAA